ncbi:4Fe-4S binding protein [bacterium]|nr:4Fe-4S binding protein [bacterium]
MKQLVIISGKGGTGKTVVSASLASLASNKVMVDCDVDAANLHLLLQPKIQESHEFSGGKTAVLDEKKCTECGQCLPVCRFDAISETPEGDVVIDPISCEGCGVCFHICPVEAIHMRENISGNWYVSQTPYGPFVHAKLGIAEENSGKLVTEIKKRAQTIAEDQKLDWTLLDGSPGIGCPVIASLSGVDMALVVTEPTLSGIHDLERVTQMAAYFNVATACCINKYDLNLQNTSRIEKWCERNSIPVMGKIPYEDIVVKSMVQGIPLVEYAESNSSREIKNIWKKISRTIHKKTDFMNNPGE